MSVGLHPYFGYGLLESSAIDAMNERLGNSPRLIQPYQFGRHAIFGASMNIWTDRNRFAYGLSAWSMESALRGSSTFPGVDGSASLGLTGLDFSFQFRALPWKIRPTNRSLRFSQRFLVYAGFELGYAELSHTSKIVDPTNEIDLSYFYSSQRIAAGGRLSLQFIAADWITIILFDGRIRNFSELSSSLGTDKYLVGGREEAALAKSVLPQEFGAVILSYQFLFGMELFL